MVAAKMLSQWAQSALHAGPPLFGDEEDLDEIARHEKIANLDGAAVHIGGRDGTSAARFGWNVGARRF
jgi:hypothetical protein